MAEKFTLAKGIAQSHNNFDLIRLLAAFLVLFSHSYPFVQGVHNTEPLEQSLGFLSLGSLAVCIFFAISGLLITQSYLKRHDVIEFLAARILRIFPGLIIAILFCALLIGPLVTTLSLSDYFQHAQFWRFIKFNILLHFNNELPGVFKTNTVPYAVNGSLWTLVWEFRLYLAVALIGFLGVLKKPLLASVIIGLLLISATMTQHINFFCYAFALGGLATLLKEKIILSPWILLSLCLICVILHYVTTPIFLAVFYLTITYATFWLAYQPYFQEYRITRHGDFSYGIYIYAFPIQQTLMHYFYFKQPWQLTLYAFPLTLILAILSWHCIEQPALRQKHRIHLFLHNIIGKIWRKN